MFIHQIYMYYLERNEDAAIIFLKFYQNYAFYKRLAILKLILSEYIRVPRTELFIGLCILLIQQKFLKRTVVGDNDWTP